MKKKKKLKLDIVTYDKWLAPSPTDDQVKVLTMPNIVKPLHGLPPRVALGATWWSSERAHCYKNADDSCEVCGYHPDYKHARHAHELYDFDYINHTQTYRRSICLCLRHHVNPGVHTGRALTLYKKHDIYMGADTILEGFEDMFKRVDDYNQAHPDEEPLRFFAAIIGFLSMPELREPLYELIKKYHVKFWQPPAEQEDNDGWGKWKLIVGGKEFGTPYKDYAEWEKAMEENNSKPDNGPVAPLESDKESKKLQDEIEEMLK